jgi:hypothetical protein
METLLERVVLIRLTENGFAVTTKGAGLPESYVEYETSAAGELAPDAEPVRTLKKDE